jgi:hypothetical protein
VEVEGEMPSFMPISGIDAKEMPKKYRVDFDWVFKSSMQPDSLDARRTGVVGFKSSMH